MGFLDSLTGSGGMLDFGFQEDMVNKSKRKAYDLYNDFSDYNLGYLNTGQSAMNLLGTYLGIDTTPDRDVLYRQMKDDFTTGTKGNQDDGGYGSWDKSGDVWRWMADGQVSGDYQRDEAGLQAAIDAEIAKRSAENTGSENFGSLLDAFSLEDFEASPSYNFNLEQGQKAIDRANASRGNYNSPAAIQELLDYSQGLASNEFNNAYTMDAQNKNSIYNMLMGTANTGQNSLGMQANQNNWWSDQYSGFNNALSNLDMQRQMMELQNDRDSSFLGSVSSFLGPASSLFSMGTTGIDPTSILGSIFK